MKKKPTLKQIKKHFKNAKKVRCLFDYSLIFEVSDIEYAEYSYGNFYYTGIFGGVGSYAGLYRDGKYAEIIEYKNMNKINEEITNEQERDDLIEQLKKIKFTTKYPVSIEEVEGRCWYTNGVGDIFETVGVRTDSNHSSSREREEKILVLRELLELRDSWNNLDGDTEGQLFTIYKSSSLTLCIGVSKVSGLNLFSFNKLHTRDLFLETFKDKLEQIKEFI